MYALSNQEQQFIEINWSIKKGDKSIQNLQELIKTKRRSWTAPKQKENKMYSLHVSEKGIIWD